MHRGPYVLTHGHVSLHIHVQGTTACTEAVVETVRWWYPNTDGHIHDAISDYAEVAYHDLDSKK